MHCLQFGGEPKGFGTVPAMNGDGRPILVRAVEILPACGENLDQRTEPGRGSLCETCGVT